MRNGISPKEIALNPQAQYSTPQSQQPQIRWNAIWLGLGLIFLNNYWLFAMLRWEQGLPTTMSLFFNVIFIFAFVVVLNFWLARFAPHLALTQGELLTLYAMLSVAFCNRWARSVPGRCHQYRGRWLDVKRRERMDGAVSPLPS